MRVSRGDAVMEVWWSRSAASGHGGSLAVRVGIGGAEDGEWVVLLLQKSEGDLSSMRDEST